MRRVALALLVAAALAWERGGRASAAPQQPASAPSAQLHSGGAALPSVSAQLKSTFTFWLSHGLDAQFGGFHGTLDRRGTPIAPTSKSLVQEARHLWAFSSLLLAQQGGLAAAKALDAGAARAAADSAFTFMRTHMATQLQGGGTMFVLEVGREGSTTGQGNPSLNLYANAFAIYGLAAYARATGSAEAKQLALGAFRAIDARYHAPTGGYDESQAGLALDSIPLPAAPGASTAGAKRLSQSFNTLLHMAEALTELSRATGGSDATVTARLLEHVQLLTGPLVVRPSKPGGTTPAAFISPNYDSLTWKPVGDPYVNYGHNIEAAWLLADAVDELVARGAVDAGKAAAMRGALQDIATATVQAGYDNSHGGFFEGSALGAPAPTAPNKVWWVQAEGAQGLDWLARTTGDGGYRAKAAATLRFAAANLNDGAFGEWYWQTGPAGGQPLPYTAGGTTFDAPVKGNAWKASYHTGRALLRLAQAGY